jgi:hypothetical protein
MARETTTSTLDKILLQLRARLIDRVAEFTIHNTYLSTMPNDAPPPSAASVMCEISPSEQWTFEEGMITGGGRYMLHTRGQILTTVHLTISLDKVGTDPQFITNVTRGAVHFLNSLLEALSDHDLLDEDANELLSHPLRPLSMHIPPKEKREIGYVTIVWDVEFDWYLTVP